MCLSLRPRFAGFALCQPDYLRAVFCRSDLPSTLLRGIAPVEPRVIC